MSPDTDCNKSEKAVTSTDLPTDKVSLSSSSLADPDHHHHQAQGEVEQDEDVGLEIKEQEQGQDQPGGEIHPEADASTPAPLFHKPPPRQFWLIISA